MLADRMSLSGVARVKGVKEDITYNLTRPLKTLRQEVNEPGRRWLRRTPAMAAKLTDHIWSIEEILTTVVVPPPLTNSL